MNRREFLNRSTTATLGVGLGRCLLNSPLLGDTVIAGREASESISPEARESVLSGTAPLTAEGDLAAQMVAGIHRYLLSQTEAQVTERAQLWNRDYTTVESYERSVASNRQRFRQIIGVVDERVAAAEPELVGSLTVPAQIAQGANYKVYTVRWPVFAPVTADSDGLDAEGLLLRPEGSPLARVVAIPDADWTPEMLVG